MSPNAVPGRQLPGGSHAESEDSVDWAQLEHYLHAPLRRPFLVLVPWVAILALSVVAFFVLPKRYKSSTLILVESERVPDSFVTRVATQDRGQRLEAIRPEIMSRTRLERVVEEMKPYPEITSPAAAVERMRRAVFINISGNDGFTIEYIHTDPRKAQEVTSRIATLFIEETVKAREEQVEGALDFLSAQVTEARRELEDKDQTVRRYKAAHMGRLPEQLQANLATMQMLQQDLRSVEESLIFAREKRDGLARGDVRSPATASPGYTPSAPVELDDLRRQLALLKGRYTEDHPDVESLRARIARLDARLSAGSAAADPADADLDTSTSVAREQLAQATREVKRLEAKRTDLEGRIAAIRARVEGTPQTEQELASLNRDYDKLSENYVALLSKQLEAQMAGRLERRWKGDRFRILDPANLPEKPYFPQPLLVIGLGAVLGLFTGLGVALLAEFADPSVKDIHDLQAILAHPVLARIPHLPDLVRTSAR
jgi:polysaccharide chain length determinant protein (PEP-CTERM system associated)